ncbi:lysophospholipase [Aciduricibacillus chroicocephali]|uniref:Lysophospholipase n=1 Tax=Aciduricibacillus chroicocephali TaxID=3054939 RepID=A0ABY9KW20_9BACI|nr:lysophospholipase [Bacillaceae bacterium 44XB]
MKQSLWIQNEEGMGLHAVSWIPDGQDIKAIVQISHGLAEHIERYEPFAQFLNDHGFLVFGHDHRGHGKTGRKQNKPGYFAPEQGFNKLAEDLVHVSLCIKDEHRGIPIILLGHSMGSFIVKKALQENSHLYSGAIICGTGNENRLTTTLGKALAAGLPPEKSSPLLNKLVFGSYNKKIIQPRTNFDWLSCDVNEVDRYIEDPFCGFIPTARLFYDLLDGLQIVGNWRKNTNIRKHFPLLFMSGHDDPVGKFGKSVWQATEHYRKAGLEDITVLLFEDMRHEILNEINRDEVWKTILNWIMESYN